MKKLTQNIAAGETVIFPSCKTFVFIQSVEPVDFKFITLFNRIDRQIEGFSDTFSVTAANYFLRIEVFSEVAQEITVVLIEDSHVEYKPLRDHVKVTDGCIKVVNTGNYPVQVGGKYCLPVMLGPDHVKYSGDFGGIPWDFITDDRRGTNLNVWCPLFSKSQYSDSTNWFLDKISITSSIDTCLEIWHYYVYSTGQYHGFSDYKNCSYHNMKYSTAISNYRRVYYKDVTRTSLEATDDLIISRPLKANVLTEFTPNVPFFMGRTNNTTGHKQFLSITTKDVCEFSLHLEGLSFVDSPTNDVLKNMNNQPVCTL